MNASINQSIYMALKILKVIRVQRLTVKGHDIYTPLLMEKPEQQRFTIQTGVLTCISSRRRGATSGHSLPE